MRAFAIAAHLFVLILAVPLAPPRVVADEANPFGPAMVIAESHYRALVSGTFVGHWHDGRPMLETIQMVTPDMITMQRHSYSSSPVTFRLIDAGVFRDRDGNILTLVSATRIRWTDKHGRNTVTFDRVE
jgi:hypothetical protein